MDDRTPRERRPRAEPKPRSNESRRPERPSPRALIDAWVQEIAEELESDGLLAG